MICAKKRNFGRARWAKRSAPAMKGCQRFGVQTAVRLQRRLSRALKLIATNIDRLGKS